jgi:hypothetical protein
MIYQVTMTRYMRWIGVQMANKLRLAERIKRFVYLGFRGTARLESDDTRLIQCVDAMNDGIT